MTATQVFISGHGEGDWFPQDDASTWGFSVVDVTPAEFRQRRRMPRVRVISVVQNELDLSAALLDPFRDYGVARARNP